MRQKNPKVTPQKSTTFRTDQLILIVDHYRVGQRIALMQLNYFGLSAHVVTSCRQAIRALKREHYSLVLLGWGMSNCDGAACIRFVRKLDVSQRQHTTLVAVSAHALSGDKARSIELGMDDLISKPITMETMEQMLGRHLKIA
jgi:CheY-like chemotaxis protein